MTLSLVEAARVAGGYAWLEERLFEILGGWVPAVPEPEVKLRLAADSQHHAWHASLWRERLPVLREIDAEGLVAPAGAAQQAVVEALGESATTIEKLVGVYRVLLPRMVVTYQCQLERATPSAITDGPAIRALRLVLADELADWREGEFLIQRQLASADDVQRAATHQARLETLLIRWGP